MHNHMNFGPNYDGQDPKIDVELDKIKKTNDGYLFPINIARSVEEKKTKDICDVKSNLFIIKGIHQ